MRPSHPAPSHARLIHISFRFDIPSTSVTTPSPRQHISYESQPTSHIYIRYDRVVVLVSATFCLRCNVEYVGDDCVDGGHRRRPCVVAILLRCVFECKPQFHSKTSCVQRDDDDDDDYTFVRVLKMHFVFRLDRRRVRLFEREDVHHAVASGTGERDVGSYAVCGGTHTASIGCGGGATARQTTRLRAQWRLNRPCQLGRKY